MTGTMDAEVLADMPEPDRPLPDRYIPPDLGPDGPLPDVYVAPDQGPDVGEPEMREGEIGEPCPRGYEQDCDPDSTDRCVFIGDSEILPGVSAVCSRACDDDNPCGGGLCCFPDAGGDRCMPAGFCALLRAMGDACEDNADCPPDAPLCATEGGSGAKFCTFGCAAGGECPDDFCCDGNIGGRPVGAICKPTELCPEPCAEDADCPEVQHCVEGACVPRLFACAEDIDCPLGERCEDGECFPLDVARLGQDCSSDDVACDEGAPLCVEFPDDHGELCTYNCSFHRDCPADFCCADVGGLGRGESHFCTDIAELCPPNLPCLEDDECSVDQYCHFQQCQDQGPHDIARGGACEAPGVCELGLDCVFPFAGGRVGRGDRASFPGAGAGVCSAECTSSNDCEPDECCKIAQQIRSQIGVGYCVAFVENGVCDPGGGGGGGGASCVHPTHCNPALFDRCVPNQFFGGICSRECDDDNPCPGALECDPREGVCHPVPRCNEDVDCGDGNRCIANLCREGARQCQVSADCEDPVGQRCFEGRCAPRARPCADDGECDGDEVCFAGECEIAARPCALDEECRAGEACIDNVCGTPVLDFGEPCANADIACGDAAPICFSDGDELPEGLCTTGCTFGSDCPGSSCCYDTTGAGDPAFFVCAPEALCVDGGVPGHRACGDDDGCLEEDFCHRGRCHDDGAGDADLGEGCDGPGDCNLAASDACVVPLEFGYGLGAVGDFADAQGAGTCQPACGADGDCASGCCRHAREDGAAVGVCLDAAGCPDVSGPGEFCFPGAHDECDPATTDACIFVEAAEDSYCAAGCVDDGDCGGGCCRDVEGANYCLLAEHCD